MAEMTAISTECRNATEKAITGSQAIPTSLRTEIVMDRKVARILTKIESPFRIASTIWKPYVGSARRPFGKKQAEWHFRFAPVEKRVFSI